ncbi:MAG: nitronate monooxygenase, partial [Gemmatimonadetes bacterium]|nr:nitronate monooxygenase [Gemmatimonadota bacterium]
PSSRCASHICKRDWCAGGVGTPAEFARALSLGYAGAQLGTRFIATRECTASDAYKRAILDAREEDVVLSERLTGVPVSVLNTSYIRRMGLRAGPVARRLLRGKRTRHWMRLLYSVKSFWQLKRSLTREDRELWQAGKSVAGISEVVPAGEVVRRYAAAPGMAQANLARGPD